MRAKNQAAKNIDEFLRLRAAKVKLAIQTYENEEGLAIFESLREEFWGSQRWTA